MFPFCPNLHDELLGIDAVSDFACELEISPDYSAPDRVDFVVDAVYVDGKNLMKGDALSQMLAVRIIALAQDDIDQAYGGNLYAKVASYYDIRSYAA